jgi:hypothetical protein
MSLNPFAWSPDPRAEDDAYDAKMQRELDDRPETRVQAPTPAPTMTRVERIAWSWRRFTLLTQIRKVAHDINHYEESRLACGRRIEFLLREQQKLRAELFYHENPQPKVNRVRF